MRVCNRPRSSLTLGKEKHQHKALERRHSGAAVSNNLQLLILYYDFVRETKDFL